MKIQPFHNKPEECIVYDRSQRRTAIQETPEWVRYTVAKEGVYKIYAMAIWHPEQKQWSIALGRIIPAGDGW